MLVDADWQSWPSTYKSCHFRRRKRRLTAAHAQSWRKAAGFVSEWAGSGNRLCAV
ncbi:hypothetical protein [Cupriavidus sp. YR651]|uniref:hypothetical protein n=1 Tax=Cupriavidus sp. YR651 TaxID=1855315 RepID=UPI00159FCE81|nr:hypothetical protein [Cupriavidus sp. YR651]